MSAANRIWIITTSYPTSPGSAANAGVLARQLALQLVDRDNEVTVLTPAKPGGVTFDPGLTGVSMPWLFPTEAMADIKVASLRGGLSVISLMVSARHAIFKTARTAPPTAIIAMWALPSGIFASWARSASGADYAVWLLGSDVWQASSIPFGRRMLRSALRPARAVFADGYELAREARDLTGLEADFLPSVVALPDGGTRPERDCAHFSFVGRYHPNKGPDVLISAIARAQAREPSITATLHGSGELRASLIDQVDRLKLRSSTRVEPPIDRMSLAQLLQKTTCLVIPSRRESIPMIISDAAQIGTPVIATDVGDMGRVGTALGAMLVPPDDPDALADAMIRVVRSGAQATRPAPGFEPTSASDQLIEALGL